MNPVPLIFSDRSRRLKAFDMLVRMQLSAKNPPEKQRAFRRCMEAAQQGLPEAQRLVGFYYEHSFGTKRSLKHAAAYFRLAAHAGDVVGMAEWGRCLLWGYGIRRNYKDAHAWLLRAAKAGDTQAPYRLGQCYQFGYGVGINMPKAKRWYELGARRGHADAQFNLAKLLEMAGRKGWRNGAIYWYRAASRRGDISARCNLGLIYLRDPREEHDHQRGLRFMRSAACNGDHTAVKLLAQHACE